MGVNAIIEAAFEQRPRCPAFRRRPYCFGSADARSEYCSVMNQLVLRYASCSERFRFGQRGVEFPSGTYPPPIIEAAA